jgi:hypothetical protein
MQRFIEQLWLVVIFGVLCNARPVAAQDVPADYQDVLKALDKKGDFKAGVLKVNIPRNDLKITVQGFSTPTPFGFGGWMSLTKATDGSDVMMGDLVLLQDEINPVLSALLENGIEVTALHNHFFWDEPHVYYMHVHGMGKAVELAQHLKPALDLIGHIKPEPAITASSGGAAMLESELTPVLKALRKNGLNVVAIHHHMTGNRPVVIFLHYWGRGPAEKLAIGFRAAVDELGKK